MDLLKGMPNGGKMYLIVSLICILMGLAFLCIKYLEYKEVKAIRENTDKMVGEVNNG